MTSLVYSVSIPYSEFRNYLVETDKSGPWGDKYFHSVFDKYVEDDFIEIEYKYGKCVDWKTEIIWRPANTEEKAYSVRYSHSSPFAIWWCNLTDELEDELEE